MITDSKLFKSELAKFVFYQKRLSAQKELLELTYNSYSSPSETVDAWINDKKISAIKIKIPLTSAQQIELDDRIFQERERLRKNIQR